MKVKSMKGFTLAELLIVMAIIVVLAAIAIPTFGKQLETARETADAEAIRALATDAFSEAYTGYVTGMWAAATKDITLPLTGVSQKTADFQYIQPSIKIGTGNVTISTCPVDANQVKFTFGLEETTTGEGNDAVTTNEGGIKLTAVEVSKKP